MNSTTTHPRIGAMGRQPSWTRTLGPAVARIRQRLGAWARAAAGADPAADSDPRVQANRVRTLAMKYVRHDPHFAADLFAAADRHEEAFDRSARTAR